MSTDNTKLLASHIGEYVRVNYNVAQDSHKPSVMFGGTLRAYKTRYYEIKVSGATWIAFTDENISKIWDEKDTTPYVELKI